MRLALASASALLPCAAAQAESTLYGRLNLSLEYVDARRAGVDEPSVTRVSSNSSRIGFRGFEYLGRGTAVTWQIESSISADSGGGQLAGRETFLGFEGTWGALKLGNFLTPYDDLHPIFGNVPTLTTSILTTSAIWAQGALSKVAGGFDARMPNSIRYDTPEYRGLEASIQYSLGEDVSRSHVVSLGGLYTHGAFEGGIAYERNRGVRSEGLNDWALTTAAAWNFGTVRVAGIYERLHYETPIGKLTRNFYGASATILVGAGSFYLFWGHAADGKAAADVRVGGLTTGPDSGGDHYEMSYTYALSTRTLLYGGYVRIANEARASYNFGINPYTGSATTGLRLNGFALGAAHFF